MNRFLGILVSFAAAGCGHSLWPTISEVTPVSSLETFTCVDSVSKSLGYKPFQTKPEEGFLRTRKTVPDPSRDTFDQDAYDQLQAQVSIGPGVSRLSITAQSYTEQLSRRGREQVEKAARPDVVSDAKVVMQVCGTGRQVRTDRVPSAN